MDPYRQKELGEIMPKRTLREWCTKDDRLIVIPMFVTFFGLLAFALYKVDHDFRRDRRRQTSSR
jgi:hypothetical protein